MGFKHWKRVEGSKFAHCLQQCNAAPHLGHLPFQSTPGGNAVEQLKQRAATTFCKSRGRRGPVTSIGGRGPFGFGRSPSGRSLDSRPLSIYPRCLYLRSSSMCLIDSWNSGCRTATWLRWSATVHRCVVRRINRRNAAGTGKATFEITPAWEINPCDEPAYVYIPCST